MVADDNVPYIIHVHDLSGGADQILLTALLYISCAYIGVVAGKGVEDIPECKAMGDKFFRVRGNMKLPFITTDAVYLCYPGDIA